MSNSNNKVLEQANNEKVSEITTLDIINLISLKNIKIKDLNFVKDHITIQKSKTTTTYEISVQDVDNKTYSLTLELKTYT